MQRVFLNRSDRLGDALITSSLLPGLRTAWTDTELSFVVADAYVPLFAGHPALAAVIPRSEVVEQLSATRPTAIIHFQPDPSLVQAAREAGVSEQVGYRGRWWSPGLSRCLPDDRPLGERHEAESAAWLAAQWRPFPPTSVEKLRPSVVVPPGPVEALKSWREFDPNRAFALNPSAYSNSLRWPWPRFLEVCRYVHRKFGLHPILISGDSQDPSVLNLARGLREAGLPVLDLAGKLSLVELARLLGRVRFHLARNTGTSHLAGAMGCPQVELFIRSTGRYSIRRWRALGSPSRVVHADLERHWWESSPAFWARCAQGIAVEAVCHAIDELMQRKPGDLHAP